MNFGQSLLYGAFGSLTGGMGCFGGGYGMGMGGFGMGGSLFTMPGIGMGGYGFGGFGMGCYSDQMIGMQVGTSIMQYAMFGISRAIEGRGAAKAQRQQAMNDASDNVSSIKSEINDIDADNQKLEGYKNNIDGNLTELSEICADEVKTYKAAKETVKNFDSDNLDDAARSAKGEQEKNISTAKSTIEENEEILRKNPENLNDPKVTELRKNANEAIKKANADIIAANEEIKKIKQESKKRYDKAVDDENTAKKAIETKIQEKIDANNRAKAKKEAELKEANQELEEIASEQVKISKKCDTDEEYQNIVGTEGSLNNCDSKNVKDFVKAFNYKFSQYCKASSKSDKQKLAKSAIEVYDKIYNCSAKYITADMKRNMNIMQSYTDNDGNQYGV